MKSSPKNGYGITPSISADKGNTMTVVTRGSLSVSLDSATPGGSTVEPGATNVTLLKLKFTASQENVKLKRIVLEIKGSRHVFAGDSYSVWDGGTKVGTGMFPIGNYGTSTMFSSVVVPKNSYKVLTIKAGISENAYLTQPGDTISIGYDGGFTDTYLNGTYGVGQESGETIYSNTKYDIFGPVFTLGGGGSISSNLFITNADVSTDFEGGSNSGWSYGNAATGVVSSEKAHGGSRSNKIKFHSTLL